MVKNKMILGGTRILSCVFLGFIPFSISTERCVLAGKKEETKGASNEKAHHSRTQKEECYVVKEQ